MSLRHHRLHHIAYGRRLRIRGGPDPADRRDPSYQYHDPEEPPRKKLRRSKRREEHTEQSDMDIDSDTNEDAPSFLQLVQSGDVRSLKSVLRRNGYTREADRYGRSPLWNALATHRFDMACLLMEHGASLRGYTNPKFRPIKTEQEWINARSKNEHLARHFRAFLSAAQLIGEGDCPILKRIVNLICELCQHGMDAFGNELWNAFRGDLMGVPESCLVDSRLSQLISVALKCSPKRPVFLESILHRISPRLCHAVRHVMVSTPAQVDVFRCRSRDFLNAEFACRTIEAASFVIKSKLKLDVQRTLNFGIEHHSLDLVKFCVVLGTDPILAAASHKESFFVQAASSGWKEGLEWLMNEFGNRLSPREIFEGVAGALKSRRKQTTSLWLLQQPVVTQRMNGQSHLDSICLLSAVVRHLVNHGASKEMEGLLDRVATNHGKQECLNESMAICVRKYEDMRRSLWKKLMNKLIAAGGNPMSVVFEARTVPLRWLMEEKGVDPCVLDEDGLNWLHWTILAGNMSKLRHQMKFFVDRLDHLYETDVYGTVRELLVSKKRRLPMTDAQRETVLGRYDVMIAEKKQKTFDELSGAASFLCLDVIAEIVSMLF